jgi:hypothetical protein
MDRMRAANLRPHRRGSRGVDGWLGTKAKKCGGTARGEGRTAYRWQRMDGDGVRNIQTVRFSGPPQRGKMLLRRAVREGDEARPLGRVLLRRRPRPASGESRSRAPRSRRDESMGSRLKAAILRGGEERGAAEAEAGETESGGGGEAAEAVANAATEVDR